MPSSQLTVENIKVAFFSIKSQLLRTILTILIIAFGIMALVGILTAIDSIKSAINTEFTLMGANTFTIRNKSTRVGKRGQQPKKYRVINYKEALQFQERFKFPGTASISALASFNAVVKYESEKTNANVSVFGTDENYLATGGYQLEAGRNFTAGDIEANVPLVIIGSEIAELLFPNENPIDKVITIVQAKYRIIGVLKEKGSSIGFGGDRLCLIPVTKMRQQFSDPTTSFTISVLTPGPEQLDAGISESTGLFRVIRKDPLGSENTFDIRRSDSLTSILIESMGIVTLIATIIAIITLFGAAIGLMNIMLVSVTERTREIGTRKAMGATQQTIRRQFLTEAIVICQLGGLLGIVFGIVIGNITSVLFGISFIIPWLWMTLGVILCFVVGVVAGYYPAVKAASLDPIEALRYE